MGLISHATRNREMYTERGRYVTRKMVPLQGERAHSLYFLYAH